MKNHKVLMLILATTFSPLLIAAILTTDYFSQQLEQKQYGKFLSTEIYLSDIIEDESKLSSYLNTLPQKQWQLVISPNHKNFQPVFNKLNKIKTALGKRSDLVRVISSHNIDIATLASEESVYIATPRGQLLLAYTDSQVGKPLFKDLSHLLRSNN